VYGGLKSKPGNTGRSFLISLTLPIAADLDPLMARGMFIRDCEIVISGHASIASPGRRRYSVDIHARRGANSSTS